MSSAAAEPTADEPERATGVVAVGMCITIWWPAFTLGAWGQLFFDQILTVWAAATAALFVVVFRSHGEHHRKRRAAALLLPTLWLVLAIVVEDRGGVLDILTDTLGHTVAILGIPATIWVLARIIWPEFGAGDLPPARRILVISSVLVIALTSYLLGVNHAAFLTCGDFSLSGNSEPQGCVPEGPRLGPGR